METLICVLERFLGVSIVEFFIETISPPFYAITSFITCSEPRKIIVTIFNNVTVHYNKLHNVRIIV